MAERDGREFLDSGVLARLSRLPFQARSPMVGSISGYHKSPHRGSSVEFAEYRKYVQGDDIRHLDWRVFGRSDRFYMKEFEADTNLRCYLVLDASRSMAFEDAGTSKWEVARRMAATLAYLLVHQGDSVGLTCFSDRIRKDIPPRHTPSHLRFVFDALAETEPEGATDIVGVLHTLAEKVRRRAVVIVFSDCFTEISELLHCFQHIQFRKHDLAVFQLLAPAELSFEFDRPTRFADMESSFRMVTDPAMMRDAYLREVNRHLDALKRGCREFNVDYQRVSIDSDYEKVLADFLLQRIGR